MTTIHMDVDSVRSAKYKILQSRSTLLDALTQMDRSTQPVIGSVWKSQSANEFNMLYQELRNQVIREIHALEDKAEELERQIQHWEAMAARLGL